MNTRRLSGLLKELKKIFRRRRKLGLSFGILVLAALAAATIMRLDGEMDYVQAESVETNGRAAISVWRTLQPANEDVEREQITVFLREHDVERIVDVYTEYVCGEEKQSYGKLSSPRILELMEQHPTWRIGHTDHETISFYDRVDDLSDSCKQSAYIGIDGMDQLTLFDGLPQYDNVMRTFFQLDVEYLKTSLPPEALDSLYNGIRVHDLAQYNSVISTFSQFAVGKVDHATEAVIHE